jgi:glycosyltransferase involved in cell wall biosynthesis
MSVYNGKAYLSKAIGSILGQSYKHLEFIIINDGSDDDSLEIIRHYMSIDNRIVLIDQKNKGLTKSLNIGIKKATGVYIARQDADDISSPDRFKLFIEFIRENNAVDIYTTPAFLIDEGGFIKKTIPNYFRRDGFHPNMLNYFNSLIHGTLIIKTDIIKKFKYNEDFKYSQDFEMYHKLIGLGYKIRYDKSNISYKLRMHNMQISATQRSSQFDFVRRSLEDRGIKAYKKTLLSRIIFRLIDVVLYVRVKCKV